LYVILGTMDFLAVSIIRFQKVDLLLFSFEKLGRCLLGAMIMISSFRQTHLSGYLCIHSPFMLWFAENSIVSYGMRVTKFGPPHVSMWQHISECIKFSTCLGCNALGLVDVHWYSRGMYCFCLDGWIVSQASIQQEVVLLIDYVKAFYSVLQRKLWDMRGRGYHEHLIRVIKSLIWLRHCATSRQVVGLIPYEVIGIFNWPNTSSRTLALGSTQPLTNVYQHSSWG
jgi:hypothetical protein